MYKIDDVIFLINNALEGRGWKRINLAKALKISPSTLSKKMKKKRGISIQFLLDVANALGVDPASLMPSDQNKSHRLNMDNFIRTIVREELEKIIISKEKE